MYQTPFVYKEYFVIDINVNKNMSYMVTVNKWKKYSNVSFLLWYPPKKSYRNKNRLKKGVHKSRFPCRHILLKQPSFNQIWLKEGWNYIVTATWGCRTHGCTSVISTNFGWDMAETMLLKPWAHNVN